MFGKRLARRHGYVCGSIALLAAAGLVGSAGSAHAATMTAAAGEGPAVLTTVHLGAVAKGTTRCTRLPLAHVGEIGYYRVTARGIPCTRVKVLMDRALAAMPRVEQRAKWTHAGWAWSARRLNEMEWALVGTRGPCCEIRARYAGVA